MVPPEGAWMTRDGDVIEIGCHTGSKTWSLTCEDNEWIGVLGQCGSGMQFKFILRLNSVLWLRIY